MTDPILEEIWRVREKLIQEHGGVDGYFQYIQQLDAARRRKDRQARAVKVTKRRTKKLAAG